MDLQEIFHTTGGGGDDDDDDDDGTLYSPLSCDLCQKMFTTPAEWVRHIEAHPENQQQRGRRPRRQSRVTFVTCCQFIFLMQSSDWTQMQVHEHCTVGN
jgi:hypothetical protein